MWDSRLQNVWRHTCTRRSTTCQGAPLVNSVQSREAVNRIARHTENGCEPVRNMEDTGTNSPGCDPYFYSNIDIIVTSCWRQPLVCWNQTRANRWRMELWLHLQTRCSCHLGMANCWLHQERVVRHCQKQKQGSYSNPCCHWQQERPKSFGQNRP